LEFVPMLPDHGLFQGIEGDDGSGLACAGIFATITTLTRITVLRHAINLGKDAATKSGTTYDRISRNTRTMSMLW
jgi:hypothetical protein